MDDKLYLNDGHIVGLASDTDKTVEITFEEVVDDNVNILALLSANEINKYRAEPLSLWLDEHMIIKIVQYLEGILDKNKKK